MEGKVYPIEKWDEIVATRYIKGGEKGILTWSLCSKFYGRGNVTLLLDFRV